MFYFEFAALWTLIYISPWPWTDPRSKKKTPTSVIHFRKALDEYIKKSKVQKYLTQLLQIKLLFVLFWWFFTQPNFSPTKYNLMCQALHLVAVANRYLDLPSSLVLLFPPFRNVEFRHQHFLVAEESFQSVIPLYEKHLLVGFNTPPTSVNSEVGSNCSDFPVRHPQFELQAVQGLQAEEWRGACTLLAQSHCDSFPTSRQAHRFAFGWCAFLGKNSFQSSGEDLLLGFLRSLFQNVQKVFLQTRLCAGMVNTRRDLDLDLSDASV